jgi:PTH1 family peptidyl-tRNA hydrolase
MYLIAGLGNPGTKYEMTRHNIGFHTIDYIADELGVKVKKLKYKALYGECEINGEKVLLVKPQTYMNLSGESIIEFVKFFKIPVENVIIISDDIALDTGRIRVRGKGSAGGHNGLKSIIYMLNSDAFARVRIGVGAPQHKDHELADFVLGRFGKDEIPVLEEAIIKAYKAVKEIIARGFESAMNKYNGK